MSNTCSNTLVLTGPRCERDRFVADIEAATQTPRHCLFDAHVPVPAGEDAGERWGTQCLKWHTLSRHDLSLTEYSLGTTWSPPTKWFEGVCVAFPGVRFRMFIDCVENGYAGYLLGEQGTLVSYERIDAGFEEFFAARGRPGFIAPLPKAEEPNPADDDPSISDFEEHGFGREQPPVFDDLDRLVLAPNGW